MAMRIGNAKDRLYLNDNIKVISGWSLDHCLVGDYVILTEDGFITLEDSDFNRRYKQI